MKNRLTTFLSSEKGAALAFTISDDCLVSSSSILNYYIGTKYERGDRKVLPEIGLETIQN